MTAQYRRKFCDITGYAPLPYQERLHAEPAKWTLLRVPTGLGKTDAALVDWLVRRPTSRLVWCLPSRSLTKQVAQIARRRAPEGVKVLELMGGSEDLEQRLGPDEPAILVGTQDILISRALNRGYARSPFQWPCDFGLLNNDTQWVFDEIQLLGDALASSAQLAAFREKFGTFGDVPCVWMSATADARWLDTVDFRGFEIGIVELDADDFANSIVKERWNAPKELAPAPPECRLPRGCAAFAAEQHREGQLTLVIANTIARAREIWSALRDLKTEPVLLHSRYRPKDREEHFRAVMAAGSGIVVSTQVIEAGVDLDAALMVTDVAPWASLVQRFGRVNRKGQKDGAQVFWVDRPLTSKRKNRADGELKPKEEEEAWAPYEPGEVREALARLGNLQSAALKDLPDAPGKAPYEFVLRRADLLDLFDTTPDLAGNQLDVSRFVRSGRETDVYVAWREWAKDEPPPGELPRVRDEELCAIPLWAAEDLVKRKEAWTWQPKGAGEWRKAGANELFPGMRLLLRSSAGGYRRDCGWTTESDGWVEPLTPAGAGEESHDDDHQSAGRRVSLAAHTDAVVRAAEEIIANVQRAGLGDYAEAVLAAARKHDWGKAHPVFQQTMYGIAKEAASAEWRPPELLGKQARGQGLRRHNRRWFRHELASALAMLAAEDPDLAAYLAASHHGKVRLNIRSMPGEVDGDGRNGRVARGIREPGDRLFAADLGGGVCMEETELSLGVMNLGVAEDGTEGWSDRMLRLLEKEGPFRLAYLEMLLRAADGRGSDRPEKGVS